MKAALAPFLGAPIAHRGYYDHAAGRAENSAAAFRAAIEMGYAIELDLQLSADGQAIVFHDDTLDRMTQGAGALRERTAREICAFRLTPGNEIIATFREILSLVAGKTALLIELKDQTGNLSQSDGTLENAVINDLKGYDGPVALMSFNPSMVAHLTRIKAPWPLGLTTAAFDDKSWPEICSTKRRALADISNFNQTGACFFSHQADDLAGPAPTRLRKQGITCLCWTIRSQHQEKIARKYAQNITFEGYQATLAP